MDTSLEYVRMCKGASEIQSQWKFEVGDYFSTIAQAILYEQCVAAGEDTVTQGCSIVDRWWLDYPSTKKHLENGTFPEPWAWLPRQDQLQEMLKGDHRMTNRLLITRFQKFVNYKYLYLAHTVIDSMEQLWLAYVMDHVYAKRWYGSEWIPSIGGA